MQKSHPCNLSQPAPTVIQFTRLSPIRCFAELRVRRVHLADCPAMGNVLAGAGRARSKARKAKVTRSNRVGCARKACAGSAGTVAAVQSLASVGLTAHSP